MIIYVYKSFFEQWSNISNKIQKQSEIYIYIYEDIFSYIRFL